MAAFAVMTSPLCAPAATLARYALGAGAAGRRGEQAVRFPAGCLTRLGGRRAVVVVAAAAGPGGSGDGPTPPFDKESVVGAFRLDMELFRLSQRALAFLGATELNLVLRTAKDSQRLFECLLANGPAIDAAQYKELVRAGNAMVTVSGQCAEGYVRADALVDATQGLKLAGDLFFPDFCFPEHMLAFSVPLARADVADMEGYLRELVQAFLAYYGYVGWEAHDKYNFNMIG